MSRVRRLQRTMQLFFVTMQPFLLALAALQPCHGPNQLRRYHTGGMDRMAPLQQSSPLRRRSSSGSMSNVAVDVACPPVYEGPSCNELSNIVASIELEESGLIVEVADSLVANGGRGLFVRLMDGVELVTLDAASPFCGYASGSMQVEPDALGGKTVAFLLGGLDTAVFFEGRLATIRMLLQDGENIERIAGHDVLRGGDSGEVERVEVDHAWEGPRYFIPASTTPDPIDIMGIGQFANDLAIGRSTENDAESTYEMRSKAANLLVLVQRLERDPNSPGKATLRPSRPISTLSRDITFRNTAPMEIGCEYGAQY